MFSNMNNNNNIFNNNNNNISFFSKTLLTFWTIFNNLLPITLGSHDYHTYGDSIGNSCVGKADGTYWLLFSDDMSDVYKPVKLQCSNEYVILDYSKDANIESYFSSFEMWHYKLGGPSNNDPVTWEEWFLSTNDNDNARYLISPDCNVCDETSEIQTSDTKTSYWMTGNLAKLHWPVIGFNECDMDWETYQCYDCSNCMQITVGCEPIAYEVTETDFTHSGICGVTTQTANTPVYTERKIAQSATGVINYKPSIGTANEFCVCYQPQTYQEFKLTVSQEEIIATRQAKDEGEKEEEEEEEAAAEQIDGATMAKIEVNEVIDDGAADDSGNNDLRGSRVIYLSQNDFIDGTLRIRESGTYVVTEDIIFDFNNNDDYWPRSDQSDEYPGAAGTRDPYHLGFFAGITIETDYVTIDLNSHELKMSLPFYYQQRWFAIIELGNQQFLPGQGPAFFGPDPVAISEITIKNGILGRTSHFGIHGNFPTGLTVENLQIKDFVTHGMQLNGWNDLIMNNIEIGPSSQIEYLRGDYGHGRIILQRLRWIENEMMIDGTINDITVTFPGRSDDNNGLTITDIADELEFQLEMAYNYALNRANRNNEFKDNDYINNKYTDNDENKLKWIEAKKQFVHESGLPSASSITGLFLNFEGASVFSYTMYTERQSSHAKITNIYIHDIYHDMVESMRLSERNEGGQMYPTPWNSDIPAESAFGSKDRMLEFYSVASALYAAEAASKSQLLSKLDELDDDDDDDWPLDLVKSGVFSDATDESSSESANESSSDDDDDDSTSQEIIDAMKEFTYVGSALSDAYFAMAEFSDDWGYLGFLETDNSDASASFRDWVFGNTIPSIQWVFGCNQDIMGHSGKGLLGFRMDGVKDVMLENIVIENLHQHTPLGSYACGNYYRFTPQESGGHFKQSEPMQWGFSANDLAAMSIIASTDVTLGDISISELNNDYSQAYGIAFWTGNDISLKDNAFISIKNVKAGINLDKGSLDYLDKPNRSPEACGVRLEIDDTSDYYDSTIHVNDEFNGITNIITCNFDGHDTCLGEDDSDYTMFGSYYDIDACDNIDSYDELQKIVALPEPEIDSDNDNDNNNDNDDDESMVTSWWNKFSMENKSIIIDGYIGGILFIGLMILLTLFGVLYCYLNHENPLNLLLYNNNEYVEKEFKFVGKNDANKSNYGSV